MNGLSGAWTTASTFTGLNVAYLRSFRIKFQLRSGEHFKECPGFDSPLGGTPNVQTKWRMQKHRVRFPQMRSVIEKSLREADELLHLFRTDPRMIDGVEKAAAFVLAAFRGGFKVLACGNGGSMADAMHFCEEWSGRFRNDRDPYPAIALSDPTHMSCVANDYGYDQVFARQVKALGAKGDVLLALSTSGQSASILEAAKAARSRGVRVVGFLGKGGGEMLSLCDVGIVFPGHTSDRIQEIQMLCLHAVIEAVEAELGL